MANSRERDEQTLAMLSMRYEDHSCEAVGEAFGLEKSSVSQRTSAIRKADEEHEGRSLGRFYWPTR